MKQVQLFDYFTEHKEEFDNFHDFIKAVYVESFRLISPTVLAKRFGCSLTAFHKWRIGAPTKNAILSKIADDFSCSAEEVKIIAAYFRKKSEAKMTTKGVD